MAKLSPKSAVRKDGTADLTLDDLHNLTNRKITTQDLADQCGVTRQAISQWKGKMLQKYGLKKEVPATARNRNSSETKGSGAGNSELSIYTSTNAREVALSGAYAALIAAHNNLTTDSLGASGVKASIQAIQGAIEVLSRFDAIALPEEVEHIPEMVIKVMTGDDVDTIRNEQDREYQREFLS